MDGGTGDNETGEIVDLAGVIVRDDLNGVIRLSSKVGRGSPGEAARVGNALSNRGTRVRGQDAAPLQAQGHGSVGGGRPGQGSGLASLERISILGDVEGIGLLGSGGREGGNGAEGQEEDGTHCCRVAK